MRRLGSILLWSVIAAAFIGPGTVTTAASAGASFGLALLWALVFSTGACLVLQEASARLTVVSGRNLGQALREQYQQGPQKGAVLLLVLGAVIIGCAAYEAGNILGGVSGAVMATGWPAPVLTALSGVIAGVLLWRNPPQTVARSLSVVVAVMGVAFLCTAFLQKAPLGELVRASLVPSMPAGSGILVLGLVGTTVVPYNVFLGSGLARGQGLRDLRIGLIVAVGLGGLISMAVLVTGTAVEGQFSFVALSRVLAERLGGWASSLFAIGLLGAGLSSAITAPLAAAVTARSLLEKEGEEERWSSTSWRYRAVWLGVLGIGLGFGLSGIRPVPAIILAQALNGLLLPLVAVFLFLAVNDRRLMGGAVNGWLANLVTTGVVWVSLLLGLSAISRAFVSALDLPLPPGSWLVWAASLLTLLLAVPAFRFKRGQSSK
jgi:Mn2+/Fe2+ NRAMP family transporter